ncbi:Conserved hypothetical protein [Candidatus Protochlamydia naegleriophila]|uniref:Uncharacterized protein n=1 Tax=Candidatus Protochlamydia naegleriophila TaxID=389348 RepID=A0A0U5ETN1_9BACT|nr:hypothetical protein [Candidatus Protochlamydia naegleriophila]CUI17600.1 Conserved hypothetical protein [Candidatus Protochlamydia naegleriophila]
MLIAQQTIIPTPLICEDALSHAFSFLPFSENSVELVNKKWNETRWTTLLYSVDSQTRELTRQAKKQWKDLSLQQQKSLICKASIRSTNDLSSANFAKLLSIRYCGSAHEYFLRSRSWLIFQGAIDKRSIQESVQKDPIWLLSDYTVYFRNYLAALVKSHKKVEKAAHIDWPYIDPPAKEKMVIKAKALQLLLSSSNDQAIAKYAKKKKEKESFFYRKLAKIEAGRHRLEAAKKFASRASNKTDNAFKSCAIRLAKLGEYEAAKGIALLAKSKIRQTYKGCAIVAARNGDIKITSAFIEQLKSFEGPPNIVYETYVECAAAHSQRGYYKLSQHYSHLSEYYLDTANEKCMLAFIQRNNIRRALEIARKETSFQEKLFSKGAIACAQRGNIEGAKKLAKIFKTYRESTYKQCAIASAQRGDSEAAKDFITFISYWKKDSYEECEKIFLTRKEKDKAKEFKQLAAGYSQVVSNQKSCTIQ